MSAGPIDVWVFGSPQKAEAIFAGKQDVYKFVQGDKKSISAPKPKFQWVIPVPKELSHGRQKFKARAGLIVGKDGNVADVSVVESSNDLISESIRKNIVTWVFLPAKHDGKPVACLVFVPLEFDVKPMEEILGLP